MKAAGAITVLPYDNWGNNFNIRYEGQSGENSAKLPIVENRVVTPGFFDVTGQRLVSGRFLRTSDEGGPKQGEVVLVNEALVKRDFPAGDPLGKRFYTGDTTFATIIGVVSDIKNAGPVRPPAPEIYQTYRQGASGSSGFSVVVRVKGDDPLSVSRSVQAAIRSVDRGAAISRIRPMNTVISDSVGQPRFLFELMGVFAAVALVLAVAGLYGVMSYVVAQRTRELGIRAALGSTAGRTVRLVARRGATLVGAGIVLGFIASAAVTGFLQIDAVRGEPARRGHLDRRRACHRGRRPGGGADPVVPGNTRGSGPGHSNRVNRVRVPHGWHGVHRSAARSAACDSRTARRRKTPRPRHLRADAARAGRCRRVTAQRSSRLGSARDPEQLAPWFSSSIFHLRSALIRSGSRSSISFEE